MVVSEIILVTILVLIGNIAVAIIGLFQIKQSKEIHILVNRNFSEQKQIISDLQDKVAKLKEEKKHK